VKILNLIFFNALGLMVSCVLSAMTFGPSYGTLGIPAWIALALYLLHAAIKDRRASHTALIQSSETLVREARAQIEREETSHQPLWESIPAPVSAGPINTIKWN
jgi:hypothetical protein